MLASYTYDLKKIQGFPSGFLHSRHLDLDLTMALFYSNIVSQDTVTVSQHATEIET